MDALGKAIYEFGEWRLDLAGHLLLRGGEPVPLTPKVFDTLVVLVENAGRLVPKDEFLKKVWPDAFVEEAALSQNISVLRKTLSGGDGLLIETVPKLGYRFVGKVHLVSDKSKTAPVPAVQTTSQEQASPVKLGLRKLAAGLIGIAALLVATISFEWIWQPTEPKVVHALSLTTSGRAEPWGGITVDGSRVYFLEWQSGSIRLMETSVAGGNETQVAAPFPHTRIFGLSPDGSQFLIGDFVAGRHPMPLYTWPIQGGALHRIGDIMVDAAAWFPDGSRILYSLEQGVFSVELNGTNPRHLFDVNDSAADFSWRPDGSVFRFTVIDNKGDLSLWEASDREQSQHLLFPNWAEPEGECCGSWMPDGRNYVFSAFEHGVEDLWVLPESEGLVWRRKRIPLRLTNGPVGLSTPVPGKDGKRLFVFGLQFSRSALRFDPSHEIFIPSFSSKPMFDFALSRDGKWLAYIGEGELLWRSRIDGTEAVQLISHPLMALRPRWSPDGSHILFMGHKEGTTSTPYIIPSEGGAIVPVAEEGTANYAQADWSPDGNSVVFDAASGSGSQEGISVIDLNTHIPSFVPDSKSKDYVRWSPDGRYLAARSEDEKELFLFDFRSQQWKHLATAQYIRRHEWDPNSSDLYFQDALAPAQTVFRVNVNSGKIEPVFDFGPLLAQGATGCTFEGRMPDGSYLSSVRASVASIYALDVELP
ncbi:MAG TPA: winged helix-turn-helix domain-containing protein [Candidatus Solibacter sp.]|nr:winged helix-turn-helix domain-containing protein [Candidatus Solibacter sp.]